MPSALGNHRSHACAIVDARSDNGKYLASIGGSDDNNLVIWNVATGKAVCGSPASHDQTNTVKWMNTSDGMLVTGGIDVLRV